MQFLLFETYHFDMYADRINHTSSPFVPHNCATAVTHGQLLLNPSDALCCAIFISPTSTEIMTPHVHL